MQEHLSSTCRREYSKEDCPVKHAPPAGGYPYRMESMGDRIKQLRIARGMTQAELAKVCGVTKSAVSQWERGSTANIRLQPFLRLLEALGTDPQYLIWGRDRAAPASIKRYRGHS